MNLRFWNRVRVSDDLTIPNRLLLCLSEFCGTAILMSVGCLGCVYNSHNHARDALESALSFGMAVLMAIQCFGHISGAHINPIITLAAFIKGDLPLIEVPIYWIGQFLGSTAGFGILKLMIPSELIFGEGHKEIGICAVGLNPQLTPIQGLFIEMCISFILVLFTCGIWDDRNALGKESVPVRFGFTVTVIVLAAGEFTSAHMNPARTFGPALLNGYWEHNWIFWIGPITGSFLASTLYVMLFS